MRATILIVDDDEETTRTYTRMLPSELYSVQTALSTEGGLCAAEQHRPDAIVTDLRLPETDGLGFLRELRARTVPRRPCRDRDR